MQARATKGYRLSPQQKRLWQLQEVGGDYCAHCALEIDGPLDSPALRRAVEAVAARHEILRTRIERATGIRLPIQVIHSEASVKWIESDGQQEQGLNEEEIREGLRVRLVTEAEERHRLEIEISVMSGDRESLRIIGEEVARSYEAEKRGERVEEEVVQYAQFSEWQNRMLQHEDARDGQEYWQRLGLSNPSSLLLPFETKVSKKAGFAPRFISLPLDPVEVSVVERVAQKHKANLPDFLLACWQTLLWRLSAAEQIVTGLEVDGREYEMLRGSLGLFAKWVPIVTELHSRRRFSEVLQKVNQVTQKAREWQDYFIIDEAARPDDESDEIAFFAAGFGYEERAKAMRGGGLSFSILSKYACIERFKVKLSIIGDDRSLRAEFHYDPDLFREEDIVRLAEQYKRLVMSALHNPAAGVNELEILSESERQALAGFNPEFIEYQDESCVHNLFEEQAARTPQAIALVCEDERLTYGELDLRANRLANYLRGLGAGPETTVAICVERSLEMIIGILGILKSGGAYVPLDPGQPGDRLASVLSQAEPQVLLTQSRFVEKLSEFNLKPHCLDEARETIALCGADRPDSGVTPQNLAYVIFTSGSTGRPKGVAIEHRELFNYLTAIKGILDLPPGAQYATVSTIAADLGNTVIFPSLCFGGTLHVITQERASSAKALAQYFQTRSIDCLKIVPSHLAALQSSASDEQVAPLRRLVLGGEACGWDLIERLGESAAGYEIINHYGPTETTVGVLTYRIEKGSARPETATAPLGRPIANTKAYILRPGLLLAPIFVPGELHITGANLARGYLNRPDLTAEKFIPDPFATEAGARMYRTGDLARYLPNGDIEFLGRSDDQVKIRGYRVEPGEIEAALRRSPFISEAVVFAREDSTLGKQLVAYLVLHKGARLTPDEARRFLQDRLPDYMIPSSFVLLDRLPLTANGKLDRKALPPPERERPDFDTGAAEARTPFEEILVGIWAELLGVERLRTDQNFFDLGGHSLLATQLISRVRDAFKVEITLRSLFESPSIAKMAQKIEALMASGASSLSSPIEPRSREQELPLSFAQQRLWFIDQLEPQNPSYNISKAVTLTGPLNTASFEQCLSEIIRRHEVLRTTFPTVRERPAQVINPPERLRLPLVDLSRLPRHLEDRLCRRLAAQEAQRPFDLACGPLARYVLIRRENNDHVAVVTMHHIVSDAWSAGVFVNEVSSLYGACSKGKPSPFAELAIQYADYAFWQREMMEGGGAEEQMSYWRGQLAGAPAVSGLKTDHPRPEVATFRGASQSFALGKELSDSLKALSKQEGATLFITLLAGFQTLLHYYTKEDDLVIGTDVACRNKSEAENLIGYFANQLVLRTDLSGDPTFSELLARVREVALSAYANQDLSFDRLVEALNPERSLKYSPLFQVKIVYQNVPAPEAELAGLKLEILDAPGEVTKFDLTMFLRETEGGVAGWLEYKTDLFDPSTISTMLKQFEILLEQIVQEPQARLGEFLIMLDEFTRKQREMDKKQLEAHSFNRFKSIKPKMVSLPRQALVNRGGLGPGERLPLLIEPAVESLCLEDWAGENRQSLEADLLNYGAILFRGFDLSTVRDFERVAQAICSQLFSENGELPRSSLGGKVYTPVEYPADKPILWHNENTFCPRWPGKIMFFCLEPADQGGETPIADSRRVYNSISPDVIKKFAEKKIMYLRNYGEGLGLSWQSVFQSSEKSYVEDYCRKHSIEFEWKRGDQLRTRTVRPAVIRHPKTGEMVWFNQATHWHIACLDPGLRQHLGSLFDEQDLPRHCYYGDGTPIEEAVMEEVCEVFRKTEVSFPWRKGDMLLLDNMLTAHARNPYAGQRRIAVTMGEMITDDLIDAN